MIHRLMALAPAALAGISIFAALPASVYLRGFVQEIAKFLKLDPTQVARTYLRRYAEWRTESSQQDSA